MIARFIFAAVATLLGAFLIGVGAAFFLSAPWAIVATAVLSIALGWSAVDFVLDKP